MRFALDETHDCLTQSWVESANDAESDFPLQNLPFGVFRRGDEAARVGVAIGDSIVDLAGLNQSGLLGDAEVSSAADACLSDSLNGLMALGTAPRRALRRRLFAILRAEATSNDRETARRHLLAKNEVAMQLPARVGDYTDFYASIFHATNVGKLFRPDNPLLPNYKYVPIGYHGRASSLVTSGTKIVRPSGQRRVGEAEPTFGPSRSLDYEMELGFFVSAGNKMGEPIPMCDAEEHIFGVCLLNDWSARDVQAWEYQPLGPFLAKNFSTSLSPWVVTMEALAPFRVAAFARAEGDPAPLNYLQDTKDQAQGGVHMWLEVRIATGAMREHGMEPTLLGRSNACDLYWTLAQMITHHASNGCNLRAGDLLGSGTVSGEDKSARGCLLELTSGGKEPVALPDGEQRRFLEDGDEVIIEGYCQRDGFRRIGLGRCSGIVIG